MWDLESDKELLAALLKLYLYHSVFFLDADGENVFYFEDITNTLNHYFSAIREKLTKYFLLFLKPIICYRSLYFAMLTKFEKNLQILMTSFCI